MSRFRFLRHPMRPPFSYSVKMSREVVIQRIHSRLSCDKDGCCGQILDGHVNLMVGEQLRHIWSPYLSLEIEAVESGSIVKGKFGPHPDVWTFWVLLYSVAALGVLGSLTFGLVQLNLGSDSWGFFGVPIFILIILGLYLGSMAGQTFGSRQMHMLENFLYFLLDKKVSSPGTAPGGEPKISRA